MNTTKFGQVSLIAICIGLGIVLFMELNINYLNNGTITVSKINMTEKIIISDVNKDFPPLSNFQTMIDRPLFMQDRQPYVYEESKQSKMKKKTMQNKTSQQLALTATIITPDRHVAIIQTGKNEKPLHVAIGEIIDNWIVEAVHPEQVVLKDGDKMMILELEIQGSPISTGKNLKKKLTKPRSKKTLRTYSKSVDTEDDHVSIDDDDEVEDLPNTRRN